MQPKRSHQNYIMRKVFWAILLSLPVLFGCKDRNLSIAEDLREYAHNFVKKDTTQYCKQWLQHLDSINLSSNKGREELYKSLSDFSRTGLYSGRYAFTQEYLHGIITIMEDEEQLDPINTKTLISAYIANGAILQETGMPLAAYDSYMQGLEIAQHKDFDKYNAMLNNNIGVIFFNADDFDQAEKYFRKALECNLKLSDKTEINLNYDNLAYVYQKLGKTHEALDMSLKGLQYINAEDHPIDFYSSHIFLGKLYSENGEYSVAKSYLENALINMRKCRYLLGEIEADTELSRHYLHIGLPDSAKIHAEQALKLASNSGLAPDVSTALNILSETHRMLGNHETATDLVVREKLYSDSIHNAECRLRLDMHEKILSQTAKNSYKQQSASSAFWFLSLLFIALIVAAVSGRKYLILKRKHNDNEALNNELSMRNREITLMGMSQMKTNEGIESISTELKQLLLELNPKAVAQKQRIKRLVQNLDALTKTDDEFSACFERVKPQFYNRLRERCSTLTQRDERLCALIFLGLSTKEIAAMTSREVRSVESSRNRLRHKLELSPNEDLSTFLKSLDNPSE